ncbi:MAG: PKD domain-containing protein [Candidatus Bathyarchaeia archaeon]
MPNMAKIVVSSTAIVVLVSTLVVGISVVQENNQIVLTVADFKNNSGQSEHDYLSAAIASSLVTNLTMQGLKTVERSQLKAVLDELGLGSLGITDEKTAARAGRLVGASRIVMGDFVIIEGTIRINARVVDVETTQTLLAQKVTGVVGKEIFDLIDELSGLIVGELVGREATANQPPIALFAASFYHPAVGETVTFDASGSRDPDGTIARYEWDLNDDGVTDQEGQIATYSFPAEGAFKVKLKVTDSVGARSSVEREIRVRRTADVLSASVNMSMQPQNRPPTPRFTFSPENPGVSQLVSFDATASTDSDGTIVRYEWDFDGDSITDQEGWEVAYAFLAAGKYTVRLKLTDDQGASSFINRIIYVQQGKEAPIPRFSISVSRPRVWERVSFDASASTDPDGAIVRYGWDFDGDGRIDEWGQQVSHAFPSPGLQGITLFVEDNDRMASYQEEIIRVEGITSRLNASLDFASGDFSMSLSAEGISFGDVDLAADIAFKEEGLDEIRLRTSTPFAGGFLKTNAAFSSSGFKSVNLTITGIRAGRMLLQISTSYLSGHLTQDFSLQYTINNPAFPLSAVSVSLSLDSSLLSKTLGFKGGSVGIYGEIWSIDYHGEIGFDTQGLRIQHLSFSNRTGSFWFWCTFTDRAFMLMSLTYLMAGNYLFGGGLGLFSFHISGLGIIPVPIPFAFVGYSGTPLENQTTQKPSALNAAVIVLPMPAVVLNASLGAFKMSTFWMFDWGLSPQRGEVSVQVSM